MNNKFVVMTWDSSLSLPRLCDIFVQVTQYTKTRLKPAWCWGWVEGGLICQFNGRKLHDIRYPVSEFGVHFKQTLMGEIFYSELYNITDSPMPPPLIKYGENQGNFYKADVPNFHVQNNDLHGNIQGSDLHP